MEEGSAAAEPSGMAPNGVLTAAQQSKLDEDLIQVRLENERYLRKHPELHAMLDVFSQRVLRERPSDLSSFAASFFSDPDLQSVVEDSMQ
ncbi:uncharacterized protein AMSG_06491 [Thecamonas trahens ATCC 50062]|uniref:RIIa domain-containing protein n=1 Tax=Thecamonas trahens ATCC 50062 TaxID=461836 RepID=A0A0L0DG28_THETB|nr:hypothetical protein AMSG_06491 [Thecamonas trahens ATCC 50062]KNC51140.1 hypothetical protein AMSG_06491 [Thecamonas trahens ATCC 50062]|eukprot:XP_013756343.1 hypothetical protein AMSG_06491 [Thecamonas trahens ATCC 50062]